ncbi:MAG: hypothetical protein AB7F22_23070 [Reyranella sp.]|uniref:hypothetical protein n=1 Tax=Reyranella sp. TaxID=1929291 RepID=UPI003D12A9C6
MRKREVMAEAAFGRVDASAMAVSGKFAAPASDAVAARPASDAATAHPADAKRRADAKPGSASALASVASA